MATDLETLIDVLSEDFTLAARVHREKIAFNKKNGWSFISEDIHQSRIGIGAIASALVDAMRLQDERARAADNGLSKLIGQKQGK